MARNTEAPIDVKMADSTIEQLLVMLVRCDTLFHSAVVQLKPEHFNRPGEVGYKAIWCAAKEYYALHQHLPNRNILEAEAVQLLNDSQDASEENENFIMSLIRWIFDETENSEDTFDIEHGREWLKQLLIDRLVGDALRARDSGPGRVKSLPAIIEESSALVRSINTISASPQVAVIPEDWSIANPSGPPLELDLNFIDNHMSTYAKDVNVILGGTGGGKTMLCTQMLTAAARVQHRKVVRGGTGTLCAYFGYEGEARDPRIRVISYAAKIMKSRLENMTTYKDLSTTGSLQEYERQRYNDIFGNNPPIGEQERLESIKYLNDYLRIYDFSGGRGMDGVARGFGGVSEIRQVLENERQTSQKEIGIVFVDWAGMALRRYIHATGGSLSHSLTHELTVFVDRLHNEIAEQFNCVVFVAHQLRGAVNRAGPTYLPTHADAEYCAMFAANAWFSLVLGAKDPETNAATLSYTKTRRGEGKRGIVLRLDGDFAHFIDASNQFQLDHASKSIIDVKNQNVRSKSSFESYTEDDIETSLTAGVDIA